MLINRPIASSIDSIDILDFFQSSTFRTSRPIDYRRSLAMTLRPPPLLKLADILIELPALVPAPFQLPDHLPELVDGKVRLHVVDPPRRHGESAVVPRHPVVEVERLGSAHLPVQPHAGVLTDKRPPLGAPSQRPDNGFIQIPSRSLTGRYLPRGLVHRAHEHTQIRQMRHSIGSDMDERDVVLAPEEQVPCHAR